VPPSVLQGASIYTVPCMLTLMMTHSLRVIQCNNDAQVPTKLARRYDELLFIDETRALTPLPVPIDPRDMPTDYGEKNA